MQKQAQRARHGRSAPHWSRPGERGGGHSGSAAGLMAGKDDHDVANGNPLGRRRRSHEVADQIERLILSGDFRAGERLPSEAELTRRLNVGRPSVREALFMLQCRGLVEISNGTRAKVMIN